MLARSRTHLVLIPSYNTGSKLVETVRDALAVWAPVWVVVDGSTDGSEKAVEELLAEYGVNLRLIKLSQNSGKGAAVLHGVNEALAQGFTHVLTMDADGQHSPAHIAPFMEASLRQPKALILGLPQFDDSAPLIRLRGRRIANFWSRLETLEGGIGDCLYGFRVYPAEGLKAVMEKTRRARRFDFDPEVAIRLFWRGHPVVNLPAPCRYLRADEGGVSHFNYWRDNVLLTWMFTRLFFGFLLRLPVLLYRKCFARSSRPVLVSQAVSEQVPVTAEDRVLFLAPHPDDESLAGGALLQRAALAGAAVRVLFATNGDNNPWPQRFVDRRWSIGSDERKRWGARRRQEARDAFCVLGLPESAGDFLGFPDQGFTSALLRADTKVMDTFTSTVSDWKPTLLVLPSPHDIHPDHNAIAVIFDLALRRLPAALRPRVLHYPVHPHGMNSDHADTALRLTDTELRRKRRAIMCHETQMALSKRRFLQYAAALEYYISSAWAFSAVAHPIKELTLSNGALCVKIQTRWRFAAPRLLIVAESVLHESERWEIPMLKKTGVVRMSECITGKPMRLVTVRQKQDTLEVRIPLAPLQPLACLFVKLERRFSFYDHAGWVRLALEHDRTDAPVEAAVPSHDARIQTK